MKRIFAMLLCAAVFTACADDREAVKPADSGDEVISFETSEGLRDKNGATVTLKSSDLFNGSATIKHNDIFWAKDYAQQGAFDGILFTTADGNARFGSYYASDPAYGEFWNGFMLTANYGRTASKSDFANQFTAWAPKGVNGSKTCMIGYDLSYIGGPQYSLPTIEFAQPVDICHVYLANTAVTFPYAPVNVSLEEYYYKVAVIGSLDGKETGRVECSLVNGTLRTADWKRVDLKSLGKVDILTFKPETNDANSHGPVAPAYFALDELGYTPVK